MELCKKKEIKKKRNRKHYDINNIIRSSIHNACEEMK